MILMEKGFVIWIGNGISLYKKNVIYRLKGNVYKYDKIIVFYQLIKNRPQPHIWEINVYVLTLIKTSDDVIKQRLSVEVNTTVTQLGQFHAHYVIWDTIIVKGITTELLSLYFMLGRCEMLDSLLYSSIH